MFVPKKNGHKYATKAYTMLHTTRFIIYQTGGKKHKSLLTIRRIFFFVGTKINEESYIEQHEWVNKS